MKDIMGETVILEVEASDTVGTLKEKILVNGGYPIDQQGILFAGKLLEHGRILADYNIQNGSTVHLILKPRKGN